MSCKEIRLLSSGSRSLDTYNQILLFLLSSELNIVLPNVVGWHIIISRSVMWRDCFAVFKIKIIAKVENFVECLSGRCLLNYLTFVAKLNMVMHHHESQCLVERLCYYQCQGHHDGSYNQDTIVSTMSSELLILLQTNVI